MSGATGTPGPASKDARVGLSDFDAGRALTEPLVPAVLSYAGNVTLVEKEALGAAGDHEIIEAKFPNCYGRPRVELAVPPEGAGEPGSFQPQRIGVVLSGGQAPGGHNVIAGIFDCIMRHPQSKLIGFLDGPHGIYTGNYIEVDGERMDMYRNTGGFDLLGSGRHKIEKPEHFAASMQVCTDLRLDGLVVIGGDDSNTNACLLAEYFLANGCTTKVNGAPKTIDGDLRNQFIPISFGFDTACKVYAEQISNVMTDALSSQKYWHMCRLMGRAASNIALEVALQTGPNVCLISEEVAEKKQSLSGISKEIAAVIQERAAAGKDYGVVLLPEGLIEFIPEFSLLIEEINDILSGDVQPEEEAVLRALSFNNKAVFTYLPETIKSQLLLDRDPHGNVQVAKIETERLLAQTVAAELDKMREQGTFDGSFSPQYHSFGYEGRCAAPTPFDTAYCYALGYTCGVLTAAGRTGMMSAVTNLLGPVEEWTCGGVPITMMMNIEHRHGKDKPVIKKALVELDGEPFLRFQELRGSWATNDVYRCVGPAQYASNVAGALEVPLTTRLEFATADADRPALLTSSGNVESFEVHGRAKPILLFKDGPALNETSQARVAFQPDLPRCLTDGGQGTDAVACVGVTSHLGEPVQNVGAVDEEATNQKMPLTSKSRELVTLSAPGAATPWFHSGRAQPPPEAGTVKIGVAFCGRQSPGGHNILCGLQRAITARGDDSELLGFVGGSAGIVSRSYITLTSAYLDKFMNLGGFNALGRTVDRVRGPVAEAAIAASKELGLDGLVLIGGSRTASDAAMLAEDMEKAGVATQVVVVPCGADGRIRNLFVPSAVGFDTMSRVTASLVGNLAIDGASARKYFYFVRTVGGEASHIAVEVALKTQPNAVLIAEEVAAKRLSLGDIVRQLSNMVCQRADEQRNFGLVIVPEGLLPAIPEVGVLIGELDALFAAAGNPAQLVVDDVAPHLTAWSAALLAALPPFAQEQLLLQRQSDGKMQLQQVETEKLLATLVEKELKRRAGEGLFSGKFSHVCTSIGYQARSSLPSNFDSALGLAHGVAAAALVFNKLNGYMTALSNLTAPSSEWIADAIPVCALLSGTDLKVAPAKLGMDSPEMALLRKYRDTWVTADAFLNPGPLQLHHNREERPTRIAAGGRDYLAELSRVRNALTQVHKSLRPGVNQAVLALSAKSLVNLVEIIEVVEHGVQQEDETATLIPSVDATTPRRRNSLQQGAALQFTA